MRVSSEATATAIGTVVAPLVASACLLGAGAIWHGDFVAADIHWLLALAAMYYFYTLVITVLFAVPAFLVLRQLKYVRWWSASLVGFAAGVIGAALTGGAGSAKVVMFWGLPGAFGALSFWMIWRYGARAAAKKALLGIEAHKQF